MSWFSRKQNKPQASGDDRYAGRPLLIVLENYVLDCIGQFPDDKRETIAAVVNRVLVVVTTGKPRCVPIFALMSH